MSQVWVVSTSADAEIIALPSDILQAANLAPGDQVGVALENGTITISRLPDGYTEAMEAGRQCARKFHGTLTDLAKS